MALTGWRRWTKVGIGSQVTAMGMTLLVFTSPSSVRSAQPGTVAEASAVAAEASGVVAEASASVQVHAEVRGVHLVVLGDEGQIEQIWSNTSALDAVVVFRTGALSGPEVTPSTSLLDAYRVLASGIDWTAARGRVWQRASS
jgi:hypothetical protein